MEVRFFPRAEFPAKICSHRYGSKMTYTEQTDSIFSTSRYGVEYYAHKYGFVVGCFLNNLVTSNRVDLLESHKYGACKFDVYFTTDYWFNPQTEQIEIIPDYNSTTWTQLGIDTFGYEEGGVTKINGVEVSIGSSKILRQPNIGVQMYEFSNGRYGWSSEGVFAPTNGIEVIKLQEYIIDWYYSVFSRYPSAMSYRNGRNEGRYMDVAFYLQCRNSSTGMWNDIANAPTWYGKDANGNYLGNPQQDINRALLSDRPSSTRWWDWVDNITPLATKTQALNAVKDILTLTLTNGGWQNNFTHWHSSANSAKEELKINSYDNYFSALKSVIGNQLVHFCNYGEASEYLTFKSCIEKVSAYAKGDKVGVAVSIKDIFYDEILPENLLSGKLPYSRVKTPISIEVDLSNTVLANKAIKTNYSKPVSLGDNKYIIEIPFPANNSSIIEIEISEANTEDYLSVSYPIISNLKYENNIITFDTDLACYSSVFEITDSNTIALVSRQIKERKTKHSIQLSKVDGKSYQIGVITEANKTVLSNVI